MAIAKFIYRITCYLGNKFFRASIEQMVALAFLMPIVASMGGNAGMQTLAVTIRAIAKKELSTSNFNRVVGKEFIIGILNGVIFQ